MTFTQEGVLGRWCWKGWGRKVLEICHVFADFSDFKNHNAGQNIWSKMQKSSKTG